MDHRALRRFARYAMIGVGTFALDLGILFLAVRYGGVPYYIATPCSFLIAVSMNYALSRAHVFKGSGRSWHMGYAYFIGIALSAAAITTGLVSAFVTFFGMDFLMARILTAGIVGIGNYVMNLYFNFRVAGKHA